MSVAFFVGWLQRPPAFLHLLHYLKQLPRLGFPSVVTLSGAEQSSDRGTVIAVFEISQQIPSDCWQLKFPSIPHLQSEKIQMLQIGRRFDRVLVSSSKTFLSLQE